MSDHLSSPRALADPASDICDLFAFPSPDRPGRLVLVMSVFPRAGLSVLFSDAVVCRFRLRPAQIAETGPAARFAVGGDEAEVVIDCTFSEPGPGAGRGVDDGELVQQVTCTLPGGAQVVATVNDRAGTQTPAADVFAGVVSDPFIFEGTGILQTYMTGKLAFTNPSPNTLEGANVLGLVVDVDVASLFAGSKSTDENSGLIAVVGETLASGKRPVRLERVGRPEIKNIGMQWPAFDKLNSSVDLRDLYNAEDAFHLGADYVPAFRSRLNANFGFFDGLDGRIDWPLTEAGDHPLVDLILQDYLVVDVSKPFSDDSWFEIERAMLDRRPHQTCGGRALNDDFLDTYYTLFINAGNGERISDGVDETTVPASNTFPYLAPPNSPLNPSDG